ncbi:hypothetical protein KFE25_009338 [Diacronema lutheri]|uniref:Uncharacterized protein n=2 Tax=Diacronema lutheri TaxID=2081491 RepID=A0A8J6CDE7_DIALT|nr:hypothetical protein KFE25_009338 [Diacronema lutheri]
MGRHLAAGALAALLALGAVQPTTQQNLDVDELLRRVDLDGGDLNLDDLLRPAADDTPDAAGAHGASRRAQPSDVPPGRAGVRHEAHASGRAEPTSARTARGEQSAAAHRAPRDERAEEIDAEIDLSDYEPQRGAAMRGFALDDDDDADADAAGRSDDGRARDDDDGEADGATDGEGFSPGGTLSLRIDKTTLAILRRWTNFANGVLLMLLGPITLAISAGSLAFDKMILSIYVSLFGLLFSAQELRVEPVHSWLRSNFQFMNTHAGRAAFLVFAGNLLWTFGRVGVVPAVLTCANSVFNAKFASIVARFE